MLRLVLCFTLFWAFIPNNTLLASELWRSSYPPLPMDLDEAIVSAFALKFETRVAGEKVPFARRLLQLKDGEIDLLAGVLKTDARETYAHFLSPPYKLKSNKIFIMRKGEGKRLQKYEDLHRLRVGVQIGSNYFPQFDNDGKIDKYASSSEESRLNMLLKDRFDALIHTELYGTFAIYNLGLQGQVEIAPYKYTASNPVYIAISKNSKLYEIKDQLQSVYKQMMESGEFDSVIQSYFDSISVPAPEFK